MTEDSRLWVVIPAAGVGRRIGSDIPKQYLQLHDRSVIDITLSRFINHQNISGIVVALSDNDEWWPDSDYADHSKVIRVSGGAERSDSVSNGLSRLLEIADPNDWVLVHDAARPCFRNSDLDLLIESLSDQPVGGLLGVPVHDTIKRTDHNASVQQTVDRSSLWHAYTPQMFRLGLLHQALLIAKEKGQAVTDDASAMELAGFEPIMIEGHADNIKITRPEDLALAEFYLSTQGDC